MVGGDSVVSFILGLANNSFSSQPFYIGDLIMAIRIQKHDHPNFLANNEEVTAEVERIRQELIKKYEAIKKSDRLADRHFGAAEAEGAARAVNDMASTIKRMLVELPEYKIIYVGAESPKPGVREGYWVVTNDENQYPVEGPFLTYDYALMALDGNV